VNLVAMYCGGHCENCYATSSSVYCTGCSNDQLNRRCGRHHLLTMKKCCCLLLSNWHCSCIYCRFLHHIQISRTETSFSSVLTFWCNYYMKPKPVFETILRHGFVEQLKVYTCHAYLFTFLHRQKKMDNSQQKYLVLVKFLNSLLY